MKASYSMDSPSASRVLYRLLPSVDETLGCAEFAPLLYRFPRAVVLRATRAVLDRLRTDIARGSHTQSTLQELVDTLADAVAREVDQLVRSTLVPVLNATGVILHTNLGRAPLSVGALAAIVSVAKGYSNLEQDLATGGRGRRERHAEPMMLHALAALGGGTSEELGERWGLAVVNNCAAATLLGLNSLAEGGEVLVSRGELVEVGGGFRIPEVMRKAGVVLREVGTTNRTRLSDYAEAIHANTRMILHVHQSNFSMAGFTAKPGLAELVALGKRAGVPVFDDQATGLMARRGSAPLQEESSLVHSVRSAPDLIAVSGDKLLGGPQCGLLLGRPDLIQTIRKNALCRALRVDKMTYAALEATLLSYATHREEEIPTVWMIRAPAEVLRLRCEVLREALAGRGLEVSVVPARSVVGGGTAAGKTLDSFALSVRHPVQTASALLAALRRQSPPVIARVHDGCVLLDLRTIFPEQDGMLADLLYAAVEAKI